ncbi:MAG: hypothetical protein U0936_17770 [Planctomycetaceae bacterium]
MSNTTLSLNEGRSFVEDHASVTVHRSSAFLTSSRASDFIAKVDEQTLRPNLLRIHHRRAFPEFRLERPDCGAVRINRMRAPLLSQKTTTDWLHNIIGRAVV